MKLYTEEQVRSAIYLSVVGDYDNYSQILNQIKPIELPSDEDIEKQSIGNATFAPSFISGAKWIKEKITKTK